MKKIKLVSKELTKIRKQLRDEMIVFGEQQKILVDTNKEHQKQSFKIDRIKKKGLKILDKEIKKQYKLDEFDYFINYESIGNNEIEIEVNNVYDDMYSDPEGVKEKLRKDKKEKTGLWKDETMYVGH